MQIFSLEYKNSVFFPLQGVHCNSAIPILCMWSQVSKGMHNSVRITVSPLNEVSCYIIHGTSFILEDSQDPFLKLEIGLRVLVRFFLFCSISNELQKLFCKSGREEVKRK